MARNRPSSSCSLLDEKESGEARAADESALLVGRLD